MSPPIMLDEGVAWKLGAMLGEVIEVDTNRSGKIWGDFIRVRVKDVDEPLRNKITSHDKPRNELFFLEVKYERVPRFCGYCGFLGHGQRDCKLPADLQEMRYTATMRASPFKKSNSKGGYVAPVASSARRLLIFGKEVFRGDTASLTGQEKERISEEVLANPLVQAAIAAVSAIKVSDGGPDSLLQVAPSVLMQAGDEVEAGGQAKMPQVLASVQTETENMGDGTPPIPCQKTGEEQHAGNADVEDLLFPPGFGPVARYANAATDAPTPTLVPAFPETATARNRGLKVNKMTLEGADQVLTIPEKRGDRENENKESAETEKDEDSKDQKKKIKSTAEEEDGKDLGNAGGLEATGTGAPGKLVGANDGARQEP